MLTASGSARAPAESQTPGRLLIESSHRRKLYSLSDEAPLFVVGRSRHCDLQLRDPEVSRRHALLVRWQAGCFCLDLGSRAGIRVGAKPSTYGWLSADVAARIGPFQLKWNDGAAERSEGGSNAARPALHRDVLPAELIGRVQIEFLSDDVSPSHYELKRPLTLIGRRHPCKIQVRRPDVAGCHVALLLLPDGLWAKDLTGVGAMQVNGAPQSLARLDVGATLSIGDFVLRIRNRTPPGAPWNNETDEILQQRTAEVPSPLRLEPKLKVQSGTDATADSLQRAEDSIREPALGAAASVTPRRMRPLHNVRLADRYRLLSPIARGGMGIVYRGHDELLDRTVAVKLVRPNDTQRDVARVRLLREATLCAQLDHPHIVHVVDVDRRGRYAVFEFIEGESLCRRLARDGLLPTGDVLRWGAGIADALQHAATRGIAHRDVKPSNILITSTGEAKLIDFGLAQQRSTRLSGTRRELDAAANLIRPGIAVGSTMFIAPEQLRDSAAADTLSDIYGLGCTLYMLLSGHPPFTGDSPEDIIRQHFEEPPPSIPGLAQNVMAIIHRCLEKAPEDRYPSPVELATCLRAASRD